MNMAASACERSGRWEYAGWILSCALGWKDFFGGAGGEISGDDFSGIGCDGLVVKFLFRLYRGIPRSTVIFVQSRCDIAGG